LLLGQYKDGKLVYAGKVGTGFNQGNMAMIAARLESRERQTAGFGEGLLNVRQRLEALYGDRASVTLTRHDGITETRVMLPC